MRFQADETSFCDWAKLMVDSSDRRILRCIALLGEPGVGKSRLIHELDRMRRNSKRRTSLYLATCAPRGSEIPLSGVTAMLHVLCGVREGSAIEEVRAIEPDLRSLGLVDIEIEAILTQLGAPSASGQGSGAPALRPAMLRMMTSLASRHVQVYVWDDAQCLDAASQKLLVEIMRRLRATRTVFVFGARNAGDIGWLSEHDTLQLDPLPPRDAERLLALRLGVRSVPPELVAFSVQTSRRASGLPLFSKSSLTRCASQAPWSPGAVRSSSFVSTARWRSRGRFVR
ncbi:MAG: AAA family ATPase [Polyangiaceae bacterium]